MGWGEGVAAPPAPAGLVVDLAELPRVAELLLHPIRPSRRVGPRILWRTGGFQPRCDPPAQPRACFWRPCPDRVERVEHLLRPDLIDRQIAEPIGHRSQRRAPLLPVLRVLTQLAAFLLPVEVGV